MLELSTNKNVYYWYWSKIREGKQFACDVASMDKNDRFGAFQSRDQSAMKT